MKKLAIVAPDYCDEMFAVRCFSRVSDRSGMGINADAELFASTEDAEPTHLHIYNLAQLTEGFKKGAVKLPASVVTVSYPSERWFAPEGTEPMDLWVYRYVDPNQIPLFA